MLVVIFAIMRLALALFYSLARPSAFKTFDIVAGLEIANEADDPTLPSGLRRGWRPFYLFPEIGGNGHYLLHKPLFWRPALDAYLQVLGLRTTGKA